MQELNFDEVDAVSGAGIMGDIGSAIGWVVGKATKMQQQINDMDNFMLGAMQYGA